MFTLKCTEIEDLEAASCSTACSLRTHCVHGHVPVPRLCLARQNCDCDSLHTHLVKKLQQKERLTEASSGDRHLKKMRHSSSSVMIFLILGLSQANSGWQLGLSCISTMHGIRVEILHRRPGTAVCVKVALKDQEASARRSNSSPYRHIGCEVHCAKSKASKGAHMKMT